MSPPSLQVLVSVFEPILGDGINNLPYSSVVGEVVAVWRDDRADSFFRRVLEITDDAGREWRVSLDEHVGGGIEIVGGMAVVATSSSDMIDMLTPAIVLQNLVSAFSFHKCMVDLCPLSGQNEACIYTNATRVIGAFRDLVDAVQREEERDIERVAFLDAVHVFISLYRVFIRTWTKARIVRNTQELLRIRHIPASAFVAVESAGNERRSKIWKELQNLMQDDPVSLAILMAKVEGTWCPEVVPLAEGMSVTSKWSLLHKLSLDRSARFGSAESTRILHAHYALVFHDCFFDSMTKDLRSVSGYSFARVYAFLFMLQMELSFLVGDAELVQLAEMVSADKWDIRFSLRGSLGIELAVASMLRNAVVKILCNGYLLLSVSEIRDAVHTIWADYTDRRCNLVEYLAVVRSEGNLQEISIVEGRLHEMDVLLLVRMCKFVLEALCSLRIDMDNRSLHRLRPSVGSCAATVCVAFEGMMGHNDETLKELPRFIEPLVFGDVEKRAFTGEMLATGRVAGSIAYRAFLATAFKHRLFISDARIPESDTKSPPLIMFAETGRLADLWGPDGALRRSVISVACYVLMGKEAKVRCKAALVRGIREGADPASLPFPRHIRNAVTDDFACNRTGICRRVVREMRNRIMSLKDVKYRGDYKIQNVLKSFGGAVDAAIVEVDDMAVLHVEIFHGWYHSAIFGLLDMADHHTLKTVSPDPRSFSEWVKIDSMSTKRILLDQPVSRDEGVFLPCAKRARV